MSLIAVAAAVILGQTQMDPNIVTWRTYKSGSYSSAQGEEIRVLTSLGDYQRYVQTFNPQGVSDGKDIDWVKEELVAIHIGTRKTGGYSVEVSSIKKVKPNEALVSWVELTPVKGVATTDALTSPWTIVRLNRPGTRLTFAGSKREGRLPGGIQIIDTGRYGGRWGDRCDCCSQCINTFKNRLSWQTYGHGDDAPTLAASTFVMSSPSDFASYVRNYQMKGIGDGSDVDWYRERLVAIHLGRKMIPAYDIAIDHVDVIDSTRVDISYVEIQPYGRQPIVGFADGPYLIVRIPRIGSIVTLTKRTISERDNFRPNSCDCGCRDCRHCGR